MTNLQNLGTRYNVVEESGDVLGLIKVIFAEDLESQYPPYDFDGELSIEDYLTECNKNFTGFADYTSEIYWHLSTKEEYDFMDAVANCVDRRCKYLIVEFTD
jgi:hypothetical protein